MEYVAVGITIVSSIVGAGAACFGLWSKYGTRQPDESLSELLKRTENSLTPETRFEIKQILSRSRPGRDSVTQ
jgi:hypothetical protein